MVNLYQIKNVLLNSEKINEVVDVDQVEKSRMVDVDPENRQYAQSLLKVIEIIKSVRYKNNFLN